MHLKIIKAAVNLTGSGFSVTTHRSYKVMPPVVLRLLITHQELE